MRRQILLLACAAGAVLASGATPPVAEETLDEVMVSAERDRDRPRRPTAVTTTWSNVFAIWRTSGVTVTQLGVSNRATPEEVRFRRMPRALRLAPENKPAPASASKVQLIEDRLSGFERSSPTVVLALDDNIDETDRLPASITFGPHSSLINLDYLRLRETDGKTLFTLSNALDPQTRRCEKGFVIVDEAWATNFAFVLLTESLAQCRRVQSSREGDLLFAEGLPEKLRQDVLEVYGPISVGLGNRLGNETGLVFVAWWPSSPHEGLRFARGWDRSSLLLFNGPEWHEGLNPQQQQTLRDAFSAEQISRRFSQIERPSVLIESAARYLLFLYRAQQKENTSGWLADALPRWITSCASHLDGRDSTADSANRLAGIECGLLVQFVYDADARSQSAGRLSLFDTWRGLLKASRRRGTDGAKEAEFLASSMEARRIVRGLLDGGMEWSTFAAELKEIGVHLHINQDPITSTASVLSLTHFHD